MKMLKCPKCGLTITDAQKECPKCRTTIEDIKRIIESNKDVKQTKKNVKEIINQPNKNLKQKEIVKKNKLSPENNKDNEPASFITEELAEVTEEFAEDKIKEKKLVSLENDADDTQKVEKEKIIITEISNKKKTFKKKEEKKIPSKSLESDIKFKKKEKAKVAKKPKTEAHRFISTIGYIVFFIPILFGFHRKTPFSRYHAKQATILFILSTFLFIGLIVLRNVLDDLFTASHVLDFEDVLFTNPFETDVVTTNMLWRHGAGVLFHFYLTWMIHALHLMPFALMLIGMLNAASGKMKPLPVVGRFAKIRFLDRKLS